MAREDGEVKLEFRKGEDCPQLMAILIAECERRNNADPTLVRTNHNTWVKKPE